jgi:hypothetical protein
MKRLIALLLAMMLLPAAALADLMYVLPESNTRLLSWDEVAAWDYESLGYAFNEIFVTQEDVRNSPLRYTIEEVDLNVTGDMSGAFGSHGGGDIRLVADFVKYVRGEQPSLACTSIDDSMCGHLTVYKAEDSRHAGGVPQDIVLL